MRCFAAMVAVGGLLAIAGQAMAQSEAVVVLTPPTSVNPVGTQHTLTATVTTAGQPTEGVIVRFTVTGASDPFNPGGFCTTGPTGQCTFTYLGQAAGPDLITGCADTDDSGTIDVGEPCGVATKMWTAPTAGCSDGGGDDDQDEDGLEDEDESRLGTLIGVADSDGDGRNDGNDDSNGNGDDDEDEDDDTDDECPGDSDGDGEDDEDEDD